MKYRRSVTGMIHPMVSLPFDTCRVSDLYSSRRHMARFTGAMVDGKGKMNSPQRWPTCWPGRPARTPCTPCGVSGLILLILDLHGARRRRDFGLELGTMSGVTCPDFEATIIQYLEWQGFVRNHCRSLDRLWVNRLFKGGAHQRTVTRFVWEQCGVNAAQIEINAHLRVVRRKPDATLYSDEPDFAADPVRMKRTINALIRIIRAV
ncbi:MAG: hypothetical protein P8186_23765 [Anaerolineae bacterium]